MLQRPMLVPVGDFQVLWEDLNRAKRMPSTGSGVA
jgi:hypothetical protein